MNKTLEAWVVVRLDGPAQETSDYVSVKGVYDSQADAQVAADQARAENDVWESAYHIFRSRRRVQDAPSDGPASSSHRVQGLPIDRKLELYHLWRTELTLLQLKALSTSVPPEIWRRALHPLIAYHAENAVARILGAEKNDRVGEAADLRLADGRTVEIKTVFLDPTKRRAPFVQFRGPIPDLLALVIVAPDAIITTAKLVTSDVLKRFIRPLSHRGEPRFSLRVTEELLRAPGAQSLELEAPHGLMG